MRIGLSASRRTYKIATPRTRPVPTRFSRNLNRRQAVTADANGGLTDEAFRSPSVSGVWGRQPPTSWDVRALPPACSSGFQYWILLSANAGKVNLAIALQCYNHEIFSGIIMSVSSNIINIGNKIIETQQKHLMLPIYLNTF